MRRNSILAALSVAVAVAAPARAQSIDQIIHLALPLIDPNLASAEPFVKCVVQNGTSSQALQSCATKTGMSQANKYVSGNSTLSTTVGILKALQQKDWITVLDLGSTDLLFKLACTVGLAPAGPLKEVLCGPSHVTALRPRETSRSHGPRVRSRRQFREALHDARELARALGRL